MNNKLLIIAVITAGILAIFVFLFSIFLGIKTQSNFAISSVSPQNNSQNVSLSPNIFITFSRPLTTTEKNTIFVSISPKIENTILWGNTNNSVIIKLNKNLSSQTYYVIDVDYDKIAFSWTFKTQTQTTTQNNEPAETVQQGHNDAIFSRSEADFLSSHPWYNNLPPENDQYYINFDANKNDFFVNLYPKINSPITQDIQIAQFKNTVIQTLRSLDIDTSSYKFEWIIMPE